jgi:hypothetical protein
VHPVTSSPKVDPDEAHRHGVTVSGIEQMQLARADANRLTELALSEAVAGRFRPVIGQTFPLERAADAHAALEAREVTGKPVADLMAPASHLGHMRFLPLCAATRDVLADHHPADFQCLVRAANGWTSWAWRCEMHEASFAWRGFGPRGRGLGGHSPASVVSVG